MDGATAPPPSPLVLCPPPVWADPSWSCRHAPAPRGRPTAAGTSWWWDVGGTLSPRLSLSLAALPVPHPPPFFRADWPRVAGVRPRRRARVRSARPAPSIVPSVRFSFCFVFSAAPRRLWRDDPGGELAASPAAAAAAAHPAARAAAPVAAGTSQVRRPPVPAPRRPRSPPRRRRRWTRATCGSRTRTCGMTCKRRRSAWPRRYVERVDGGEGWSQLWSVGAVRGGWEDRRWRDGQRGNGTQGGCGCMRGARASSEWEDAFWCLRLRRRTCRRGTPSVGRVLSLPVGGRRRPRGPAHCVLVVSL